MTETRARVALHAQSGLARSQPDDNQFRWGRDRVEGYDLGYTFLQPPPMLYTEDGHPLWLGDTYRGRSAFLICNGPSFADDEAYPKDLLRQPGVITMGINNGPKTFRPNLWCSVDSPTNWIKSIWLDPQIQKFVPMCHTQKKIIDSETMQEMDYKVGNCPNVAYYKRNDHFKADQFLTEDSFNWGDHANFGGNRSIMLVAIRLLYYLGFRKIYLLGVDFEMKKGQNNYCFDQYRHQGSIDGNNATYQKMKKRFTELLPYFKQAGLELFNCNPESRLKVFEHVPFEDAVKEVVKTSWLGADIDIANENTEGLYDREYRAKQEAKKQQVEKRYRGDRQGYSDRDRQNAKARLDKARALLDEAKLAYDAHNKRTLPDTATESVIEKHEQRLEALQEKVQSARVIFRTIEDEKRIKWGEDARNCLWHPGKPCIGPDGKELSK